ncbi:peptidoglycan DD-metalloendopeptidase family protein [Candidatus Uhrbacteria bacterium]|nr:peptidoglycan DD-metalloendopeptidase family protein [Candidatus Uhrbacteria bacterium]
MLSKHCNRILVPVLILLVASLWQGSGQGRVRAQSVSNTVASASTATLTDLETQLREKRTKIEEIQKRIKEYQTEIAKVQGKKLSLQNQLAILRGRIDAARLKIEETQARIDETMLKRKDVERKVTATQDDLKKQQALLAELLRLYQQESDPSIIEVLLKESTIASYFDALEGNRQLGATMNQTIAKVETLLSTYQLQQAALAQQYIDLERLQSELTDRRLALDSEQLTQENILTQTKRSEVNFQKLVASERNDELVAMQQIGQLEKSVRDKLKKQGLDSKLSPDSAVSFVWPVPNQGISAYFRDPDYPFRKIFEHPAVDIRTLIGGKSSNGVPIRASASGYVAKARDGGAKGYSYIMLIHSNEYSTVYGHVSSISVAQDEFVVQGQVIGLTGGAPGTHGAGPFTTGPHLHFEIRKDGVPVNPLDYLP